MDGGSASLFGLAENATYTVDKLTSSSFQLLDGTGAVVDLALNPVNLAQVLQYKFSSKTELTIGNPSSFAVGEAVRYSAGSSASVDGLTSGSTYYVVGVTATSVQLSTTRGGAPITVDLVRELATERTKALTNRPPRI